MTAIIDYGVGNLFSLKSSLEKIGESAVVTSDKNLLSNADRIILPGVGAFSDAIKKFNESGLYEVLLDEIKKGKPVLGICLGMQLLFDKSFEHGEYNGTGLISGEVRAIPNPDGKLKIPHMGWNALVFKGQKHSLFKYVNEGECVYFVHSYCAVNCDKSTVATAEYGSEITAAVAEGNVMGCQFHPEKSGDTGLNILRAFCEMKEDGVC